MTDAQLFEILPNLEESLEKALGLAHIIEGISIRIEKNLYNALGKKTSGKELNQDFSTIAAPERFSCRLASSRRTRAAGGKRLICKR